VIKARKEPRTINRPMIPVYIKVKYRSTIGIYTCINQWPQPYIKYTALFNYLTFENISFFLMNSGMVYH
jgi:hypothetical protein